MTDFVVYHKAAKMGYPALDVDNLAIYTKKSTTAVQGGRIWLIAGEGSPRKQYFLRATFVINNVGPSDKPDFKFRVTGTDGQLFDPMPRLDASPWFPAFLKNQGNFAFGFNAIKDPGTVEQLRAVLAARAIR